MTVYKIQIQTAQVFHVENRKGTSSDDTQQWGLAL